MEKIVKWYGKYGRKVIEKWNVNWFGKYRENSDKMENMEEKVEKCSWIVKRYGKYGRKVIWIVKWYGKYGRKVSWIVKDKKNMEEKKVE